eukprot:Nitzschia sp. Nitz4//scaffold343_size17995//8991//9880//NITZ4_008799-RA/size17995-snap-gene-0.19-mRNA-1//-1//CDS//3329548590//5959//frame0
MADDWDDDEWDVDDDELDAKLGLQKQAIPNFDDEEDLAIKEKAAAEKAKQVELKKKGSAMLAKQQKEKERQEELEIARKALELEADMEANMSPEERRALQRKREEEADNALTNDLFGAVEKVTISDKKAATGGAAGDKVVLKDLKDHMKYARKVATALSDSGKVHLTQTFFTEALTKSKDVLTSDSIAEIIKTCNVIKNEKIQQEKRKSKGQAQKAKKQDKEEKAKAQKVANEVFGDSNDYDRFDELGDEYEADYFF